MSSNPANSNYFYEWMISRVNVRNYGLPTLSKKYVWMVSQVNLNDQKEDELDKFETCFKAVVKTDLPPDGIISTVFAKLLYIIISTHYALGFLFLQKVLRQCC